MPTSPPSRYTVSGTAGSRGGNRWAILDTYDKQGGKGMRRVSFHRTAAEAKEAAKIMNKAERAQPRRLKRTDSANPDHYA